MRGSASLGTGERLKYGAQPHAVKGIEFSNSFSLKHGFRVSMNPTSLSVGIEPEYGVSPPAEEMKIISHSKFSTSFVGVKEIQEIQDKKRRRIQKCVSHASIRWSWKNMIASLRLITISIHNIMLASKIINDATTEKDRLLIPENDIDFIEANVRHDYDTLGTFSFDGDPIEEELNPDLLRNMYKLAHYTSEEQ